MHNLNSALAQQNENINMQSVDNHGATHNSETENEIHVTTTFAGEEQQSMNTYTPIEDESFDANFIADYDIDKFLSRPVLIGTYTMTQNTPSSAFFNVWQLYFNNTQIKKKLDNYFLLNCNLKIKMMINATPFMYGAILASYEPLPAFSADNVGLSNPNAPVLRSQRPHVWLYPQNNQGAEMTLPFYYYQEWLDVTNQGNLVSMGILTLEDIVALRSASGATSQTVTVQIYAWAENVKLAGPTYSLALQNDEYSMNGPVSSVATTVAAVTDKLGNIPVIGKYFKATSAFSSGLGKAASILGFTNTPVIDPTHPLYIQTNPTFASSEISFPEHKLTYDPKQELTVDPRVVGLSGLDEMNISTIVQRESYLTNFVWTSAAAVNTNLFAINIRPTQAAYSAPFLSNTPMAHIARMFEYWRGDIIVRFRFICSQYHRGRVRIVWDPNGDVVNNSDNTPTSINQIVDIAETTDVEIRVPYMQPFSWCRNTDNSNNAANATELTRIFTSSPGSYIRNVGFDNGNLAVKVFTNQTSQVSSADIRVIVSVRGAENLEFANPRELPTKCKFFALQNDEYELQNDQYEIESPTQLGVESIPSENRYLTHIGEVVRNLRTVLRRRTFYRHLPSTVGDSTQYVWLTNYMNRLPIFPGYDPNGVDLARNNANTSNVPYNWVAMMPYTWLASCYLGCRGSVNYYVTNLQPFPNSGRGKAQLITAQRAVRTITAADYNANQGQNKVSNTSAPNVFSRAWITLVPNINCGGCETNIDTSGTLPVQFPFYSRFRMRQCDPTQAVLGSSIDDSNIDNVLITTFNIEDDSDTDFIVTQGSKLHFGVGTDFTFLFFLNTPALYVYNDPVAFTS